VFLPAELSLEVVAVEPFRAEEGDDVLTVGRGRGVRLGGLGVPLDLRDSLVRRPLPHDAPGLPVQAVDLPLVDGIVGHGRDVALQAYLELGLLLAADGAGDEDPVSPDDRAGVPETRNGSFPPDVAGLLDVPGGRRRVSLGDAAGARAAEGGPVCDRALRRRGAERR